jgi:hypothetical protein
MAIELTEHDYIPLSECEFQHWGQHSGPPYSEIRPLCAEAAQKVWRRTLAMAASAWSEASPESQFDLRGPAEWSETSVRDWLLSQVADRSATVLVCFQPQVAICIAWGVLCDHWLIFLWTGGCVWPASEDWVLVHDGDQFVFGRKKS